MFQVTDRNGNVINYKAFKFAGGEIQVKVITGLAWTAVPLTIVAEVYGGDQILELMLLVDALRRAAPGRISLRLVCPYLPYARQDRVCDVGEALSLKVMCNIINSLDFDSVEVWDVHSNVALALLDRPTNIEQHIFAQTSLQHYLGNSIEKVTVIAPDKGAAEKARQLAQHTDMKLVMADKIRDPKDGSITGTKVYADSLGNEDVFIVDDICDGGRTFIELGKELKKLTTGRILLHVTHGIFSKGLDVFDGIIDHIYTPHVFPGVDYLHPLLTHIPTERTKRYD